MASQEFRKYYIKGDIMPFEEDSNNEFKGHLNLSKDDIPHWATDKKILDKPSRKPVSRNLNAFLNSGAGGTMYLGVMDNGKICGFNMSQLQRDHFLRNLEDLMSRYKPAVLPHQYTVHFTPVFDKSMTSEDILQQLELIAREDESEVGIDRQHVLRTHDYCWCDKESVAALNITSKSGQEFVVEVIVKRWDPYDSRNHSVGNDDLVSIQPFYADEEGKVYFRRHASVVQYNMNSIIQITKHEIKDTYEKEINRLQEQYQKLLQKTAKA